MPYISSFGILGAATFTYLAFAEAFAGAAASLAHPVWLGVITLFLAGFGAIAFLRPERSETSNSVRRRERPYSYAAAALLLMMLNAAVLIALAPWRGLDHLLQPATTAIAQSWLMGAGLYLLIVAVIGVWLRRRGDFSAS